MLNPDKPSAGELTIGGGAKGNMVALPLDFVPGNFDVLCGRGKKNYNSLGRYPLQKQVTHRELTLALPLNRELTHFAVN